MRILHVIPSLSVGQGGPTVAMGIIERALIQEGITVETATTDDDGKGRRNNQGTGLPVSTNGSLRRYFRKNFDFYTVSLPLQRWLEQSVLNYDLIHIHGLFSHANTAAARAARRHRVPYVIRPFGVLNRYGVTQRRPWLKKLSLRWIEGPLLRDAAAIHFTHQEEAQQASLLGIPLRAVVIPIGLEPIAMPMPEIHSPPTILYLSRLNPVKNLESLICAWSQEAPRFPEWRLLIAGDGSPEYVAQVKSLAASLHLGTQVEWLDHVGGARKAQLLANASIFVLPSFSENFGIAAAEALLAGKACILTPGVAIASDAATRKAAIIADTDQASLASALKSLITQPDLRKQLSEQAIQYANDNLSTKRMAAQLIELYQQILSNSRPAATSTP
jgi:glycosyltransferase involved in cell wall biosynthesis